MSIFNRGSETTTSVESISDGINTPDGMMNNPAVVEAFNGSREDVLSILDA